MAEMFAVFNSVRKYARRLRDLRSKTGKALTEADCKGIASLLEDRDSARDLIERVNRLRIAQREIEVYNRKGISAAAGLDEARHREAQLAIAVDRDVAEYLKQFEGESDGT